MKRLSLIFLYALFSVCSVFPHEVNKYMYFCMDVNENPYGIEKRFLEEFQRMGFFIMDHDYYEQLDAQQKSLTLFAEYDYFINYNGPSSLTLILRNAAEVPIWTFTGYGNTFLSAKGDMKNASKQIIRAFSKLKYKFNENLAKENIISNPFSTWSEDSIKSYLKHRRIAPIEGIYKNYSNDGNSYDIAVLKHKDRYLGIIVKSDNDLWKTGDIKLVLSYIQDSAYDAEYFDLNHQKLNAIAGLKDNRILEFSAPYNGNVMNFSFLKVFPSAGEGFIGGITSNERCKATGSGVLITDNIIVTNYHVIDGADKLEAIVNIDGIPETFSARILCTDKTNDLAIVCIKDDKYKCRGVAPFKILSNTIDVGTSVFAMGFPLTSFLGDEVKITDGIISSKSGYEGDIVTYQISVPIQPGNSGGPLFDKNGNLVGITNAGIDKSVAENVGYAIKSPYVLNIIDSAPINIAVPHGEKLPNESFPELIKALKPYVVYIKTY